jgi:hypothetical protein
LIEEKMNRAWWYMPEIPTLMKLKQEDPEFQASLDYMAGPCLGVGERTQLLYCKRGLFFYM